MAEYVRRVDREPIRVERDGPFSAHLEAGRALGYVTALRMVEVVEAKVRRPASAWSPRTARA